MLADLVEKGRSFRRFREEEKVSPETLRQLVNLARLSSSGGNKQPLKFLISWEPEKNAKIFPCLAWAASLKDWGGPKAGERPSAYVIILGDKEIATSYGVDHGIAGHIIQLGATEKGLGGCMLGAIQRDELRKALQIPDRYEILLVVALGKPAEKVVLDSPKPDGDIRYWRDAASVHHVPKRSLEEIIVKL